MLQRSSAVCCNTFSANKVHVTGRRIFLFTCITAPAVDCTIMKQLLPALTRVQLISLRNYALRGSCGGVLRHAILGDNHKFQNGMSNGVHNGMNNGISVMNGNAVDCNKINGVTHSYSVLNFNPGPSKIDRSVLESAQNELLNYKQLGLSVMEMSHRSAEFLAIVNEAKQSMINILNIPSNYEILFLQGGATGQFSAIALNLIGLKESLTADYFVTGTWSAKAVKEAEKYGKINIIHPKMKKFNRVPAQSEWKLNPEASYVYYCDNETANGVEFPFVPDTGEVPLIADMSSNILSKPVDISKFSAIIAGAQKNIGCAGVTIVIIRNDLLGHAMKECPSVLDYKVQSDMNSLYNTPPSYSIYLMGLVLKWIESCGGALAMEKRNRAKSQLIYSVIKQSNGFYSCMVEDGYRSRMNLTFHVGGVGGDSGLEAGFVKQSVALGMVGLKGHRSVGGIRVSLYNAVTLEETQQLAQFMKSFQQEHQS